MCGIVGIYSKSDSFAAELGRHLAAMLVEMAQRGPDSAGVAVYRDPVPAGQAKVSLRAEDGLDREALAAALAAGVGLEELVTHADSLALATVAAEPAAAEAWIGAELPELQILGAGREIEIYKDAVQPAEFIARYEIESVSGSHALGHTRMATESRVTAAGSHPFSTGRDLCLVHNGSLSNHNRLRAELAREGVVFRTENDSEVAAGYLTRRIEAGDTLEQALASCLENLDGFYTFAVGTADGFAVLRDPIACKPAVMAETDEWVAMASEYRALATLPGAADAEVWEPEPGVVYSWGGGG
ncbi:MAG: class II glutamine amidotransferase [Solirubrobacterales bacterium]